MNAVRVHHWGDTRWSVIERDEQERVVDRLDCFLNENEPDPTAECLRLWGLNLRRREIA